MAVNSFADKLVKKIFGSSSDIFLKKVRPVVEQINALEPAMQRLSDEELQAKTEEYKARVAGALEGITDTDERRKREQEVLNEILPEAFATIREASKRVTGMRHFDVQLIGGIAQHQGRISEMRTGEGKTLVATLPSYLNALTGRGVHVVTVNDYLASRDAEWMGRIHKFLGLTVGCIQNNLDDMERRDAYACDITYGTNNEFGFDYLRDNMQFHLVDDGVVVRALHHRLEVELHVVAQVVEPELVVGAVGDVASVGVLAVGIRHVVLDDAHGEAEEAVDPSHPLGVAAGQVVVDGDDVDPLALQRVQVAGQGRHQGLALAGPHLGDPAAMKNEAAHELNVERPHVDGAPGGFPGHREGGHQKVVEGGSGRELGTEFGGLGAKLLIRESLDLGLDLVDGRHHRQHLLHFAVVLTAENLGQYRVDHRGLARVRGRLGVEFAAALTTASLPERFPGPRRCRRAATELKRRRYEAPDALSSRM